jgi:carbon storage regulator
VLVLTRRAGERIQIGDSIVITILRIRTDHVRIGIEAPRHVAVHREEVARRLGLLGPAGRDKPDAHKTVGGTGPG